MLWESLNYERFHELGENVYHELPSRIYPEL